jgi:hypothetical protein
MIVKKYIDKYYNVIKIRFTSYKDLKQFEMDLSKKKKSKKVNNTINNLLDLN